MSRLASATLLLGSSLLLGGCFQTATVGSVGGECRLVSTPQYAVLGKTSYDQRWINRTTESLVAGCRQPRPGARPPSLDPQVKAQVASLTPKEKARAVTAVRQAAKTLPPKKREGFIRRLRAYYGI